MWQMLYRQGMVSVQDFNFPPFIFTEPHGTSVGLKPPTTKASFPHARLILYDSVLKTFLIEPGLHS